VKQQTDKANSNQIADYNDRMHHYLLDVLQAQRARVTQDANRLVQWDPAVDSNATSIWGCLVLATKRLQNQPGAKSVIIASDLENNTCIDCTEVHLDGMSVHVIFFQSHSAAVAQAKETYWQNVFRQRGAHDIQFDDPSVSEGLLAQSGVSLFEEP
jgi:hypothetical protein